MALGDDILYPESAGKWIHVVRLEGRPEHICALYDDIEEARKNKHRHQFNDDEIVSFILNQVPVTFGSDGSMLQGPLDEIPRTYDQI